MTVQVNFAQCEKGILFMLVFILLMFCLRYFFFPLISVYNSERIWRFYILDSVYFKKSEATYFSCSEESNSGKFWHIFTYHDPSILQSHLLFKCWFILIYKYEFCHATALIFMKQFGCYWTSVTGFINFSNKFVSQLNPPFYLKITATGRF